MAKVTLSGQMSSCEEGQRYILGGQWNMERVRKVPLLEKTIMVILSVMSDECIMHTSNQGPTFWDHILEVCVAKTCCRSTP